MKSSNYAISCLNPYSNVYREELKNLIVEKLVIGPLVGKNLTWVATTATDNFWQNLYHVKL